MSRESALHVPTAGFGTTAGSENRQCLSVEHAAWLEIERGLSSETAAELGVVSRPDAIGFEYRRNGALTHTKWRTLDKSRMWQSPSGIAPYFWNLDSLSEASGKGETLIITEGEFDTIAWLAAGASYAVSVPNGANSEKPGEGDIDPKNDGGFSYLWVNGKLHPDIAKFDRIVLSTDGDKPGLVLRDELAVRIGRNRCWWFDYPSGCKDAGDVLLRHGVEGLGAIYRSIKPLVPSRLVPYSAIPVSGRTDQWTAGWAGLDENLRICPPELIVVTGTPSAGKSQWTLALCCNLARLHGLRGAILQLEDNADRNRRHLMTYARAWQNQTHGINEEPAQWVDRMFLTFAPPENDDDAETINLTWLRETITEAARRHGCRWLIIDPWNEIEHVWRVNETETAYTNQALREIKRLSRLLQLAIVIVTHPGKGASGKRIEDLSLYDVNGSAAWKNKADHGIIIWRENGTAPDTYVKIDKSKDYDRMGLPGTVKMRFNPRAATFEFIEKVPA